MNVLIMLELGLTDAARLEARAGEEDVLDALDHVRSVLETVIRRRLPPDEASKLLKKY